MAGKLVVQAEFYLAGGLAQRGEAPVAVHVGEGPVGQAIEASGFLARYPEIDITKNKLGVYAKLAKPDTALRDRDRVEIYRPLIADPKEVRKQRAAEGKVMKKGGGDAE